MLYRETVSKEIWELLQKLMKDERLKDHFLVGGTALALRLGHRLSVDIDLFTAKDFNSEELIDYLQKTYGAENSYFGKNTVLTFIDDIKVDLIAHKYPILAPIEVKDGIRVISNEDIGAMKLHAIHQSGERYKDFIDMYFLLEHEPLKFYLDAYQRKYNASPYWAAIGLLYHKNITSFKGVDILPGKEIDWSKIQSRLKKSVENPSIKFEQEKRDDVSKNKKKRGFRR
ncbi:nucleotidyl transferase AbiEii/AbiGii toxin family protein [Sinomicrobium oceani]|uniref:nucleotidyl transferase AbiEii/AbiGii toxin family protein n=1 Tax=Sinomicrobium oceani TaxID=1150368 RepID=UPI00227C8ABE|nr:nucleotidyl transferase AbiEii/AbiGii toxin family protein [Sinomicrobium oceani]